MQNITHAGGIILNNKHEILLVCNKLGYWTFPRGHVEKNEDLLDAAKREISEETGIKHLEFIKKLSIYERRRLNEPDKVMVIQMFMFKTLDTQLKPQDDENPEAKWVSKGNVEKTLTAQGDKDFFTSVKF